MTRTRYIPIAGALLAALTLAACGSEDSPEPVAEADAPAAMEADPPTAVADAGGVTLDELVGLWAETAALCETDPTTITRDIVAMGDDSCIITGVDDIAGGVDLMVLCPTAGAEPQGGNWIITAAGVAPHNQITIARADQETDLVRCVAE